MKGGEGEGGRVLEKCNGEGRWEVCGIKERGRGRGGRRAKRE